MQHPTDPVSRMIDFWQEQMRSAMHDEKVIGSVLDSMLQMQQIMSASIAGTDLGAARSETASGASGDESGQSDRLARRLALCEQRLADLESRLAAVESGK